jgi:hypothetical protein
MSHGKRGRRCTICHSEFRSQIELALVSGVGRRTIAARFGVNAAAVARHGRNHLTAAQRAAILAATKPMTAIELEHLAKSESEGLLASLVAQRGRLCTVIDAAMADKNFAAVIAAERALHDNVSTVARLLGQLVNRTEHRSIAFTLTPDYLALKAALVRIVREHPELASKIAAALETVEADAAKMIEGRSLVAPPVSTEAMS